jgi:hypothetical protein
VLIRSRLLGFALAALAVLPIAACASADEEEIDPDADYSALSAPPRQLAIDEDPSVLIEHPETLRLLEKNGFDIGTRLTGAPLADNRDFGASGEGSAIVAAVNADVAEAKAGDKAIGVGMAFSHRAFDVRWLGSSEARFELIGIANRVDRRHVTPDACGEIHVVYRLAYKNAQAASRLPMTIMLIYPQKSAGGDCSRTASQWLGIAKGTPEAKAAALASGPLAGLGKANRVETNYQLVRWPSTTRTDMGGHTEYSLRVFARASASLVPVRLENTPRMDLSATERQTLATWVADNIAAIDRGTASVPQELLAEKAISASPKGLARGQNRPFAVLFGTAGERLPAADLAGATLLKSKVALVRRLDTMTCTGCHQSRGLAGFHLLGTDPTETSDVNALVDGISPHLRELAAFRKLDLQKVAKKEMQIAHIPFAEHAGSGSGGYGTVCGLGDAGFASWKCDESHTCSDLNGEAVGICVSAGKRRTGEACEESKVSFDADSHKDRVSPSTVSACSLPNGAAGRCVRSGGDPGGFPTGMCSGGCAKAGQVDGQGMCGVAVPSGFNLCIGAGKPFESCIAGGPRGYRKACDANTPCGPDYVCSAVPNAPPGVGACMPPYFIFQARVDGHNVGK